MRTDRELLDGALKALDEVRTVETRDYWDLMGEIRARLAQPEEEPYLYLWEGETIDAHKKIRIILDEPRFPPGVVSEKPIFPLYRHPTKPTGLDQLLERIRFLEQQILEKNK